MKYKYTGTDERVFPSLGVVVKPNDEFDAPDNFIAADVSPVGTKTFAKTKETTESAASDITAEEVK